MPHLKLVPALPAKNLPALPTCHCQLPGGRYWLKGAWHCIATDAEVRIGSHAGRGWHHYPGMNPAWFNRPATDDHGYRITEQENAA